MTEILKRYLNRFLHPFTGAALSFPEAIFVSWVFVFVHATYEVFKKYLALTVFEESAPPAFLSPHIALYFIVLSAFFAPIVSWAYLRLWGLMIRFILHLLSRPVDYERIDQVVAGALVSKIFLLFPVVGPLFSNIAYLFYLYAGARSQLEFTRIQALTLLFAPLVLIIGFILLEIILLAPPILFYFLGA